MAIILVCGTPALAAVVGNVFGGDLPTATALEYDGGTSPTPATKGELTKLTDESGVTSYGYDSLGRLTTKTVVTNGKTFLTTTTWGNSGSAMDKVTAITYPSGSRANYSYDAQGYLSAITVNPVNTNGVGVNTGTTLGLLSAVAYNADNNLKGWTWSDTSTQVYSYNSYGVLTGYNLGFITGTTTAAGAARTLTRDAAARITGYTHTNNGTSVPALNQTFTYDNLNRLLSANLSGSTTQYTFDASGNRKTKVVGATTYTNTISATSNRVTQSQDGSPVSGLAMTHTARCAAPGRILPAPLPRHGP